VLAPENRISRLLLCSKAISRYDPHAMDDMIHEPEPLTGEPPPTVSRAELLVDGSDAQFRQMVHRLLAFSARLEAIRHGFGSMTGLTGIQYTLLITVAHLQGRHGVGVKEIAEHLALSGAFVTIEIGKLAAAGLIEKRTNPDDRRRVLLTVTDTARASLAELAPMQRAINDRLFAALDHATFARMTELAGHMVDDADQALALTERLIADRPETAPAATQKKVQGGRQ
jgi:DNA-binding MarR family transcriptional regulator